VTRIVLEPDGSGSFRFHFISAGKGEIFGRIPVKFVARRDQEALAREAIRKLAEELLAESKA